MAALSNKLPLELMQSQWAATLNPLLASPLADASILSNVALVSGPNTINHKVGAKLQGYVVVLNSANATFYDNQSTNPMPDKTLIIVASAPTTVSILVF
jgi:hypothetical protein